jgi:hypothetical protein
MTSITDLEEEGPAVALIILRTIVPAAIEALGRVGADRQHDVASAGTERERERERERESESAHATGSTMWHLQVGNVGHTRPWLVNQREEHQRRLPRHVPHRKKYEFLKI